MPVASEFDLLCEACGYLLEGLGADGACPECGRAIAESLPERRQGTPAQRSASPWALGRTVWLAVRSVRSPRVLWDAARVGDAVDGRICAMLLITASLFVAAHAAILRVPEVIWGDWVFSTQSERALSVVVGVILVPTLLAGAMIMLGVLTWVEKTGIRMFGRMHGRRITPAVAMTIVAHASAGWLVGAALLTPAWLVGRGLAATADHVAMLRWQLVYMLPVILPALAALLGLLLFEVITWQGVMRLRYANRERPWEEDRPAGAGPGPLATGGEASAGVER